jgi:hypothetical protein
MFKGTSKDQAHRRKSSDWDPITKDVIRKTAAAELGIKRTFDAKRLNNMSQPRNTGEV